MGRNFSKNRYQSIYYWNLGADLKLDDIDSVQQRYDAFIYIIGSNCIKVYQIVSYYVCS